MMPGVAPTGLVPGTRVCGYYDIERFVRRGALASVYLARRGDTRFGVRVIHSVPGAPPPSPDRVTVFTQALESVAALKHRAMPALAAVGLEPAGLVVVTAHPGGMTLRDVIARGARLRPGDVARVVGEVASALDGLHGMPSPVVHRALTPEVVAVSERPVHVWLEEAGLARALASAGLLGADPTTPTEYASPEELLQRVDPRADIFGLASIAFECLTGVAAFRGASRSAIETAILRGTRPSVRVTRQDLPPGLDDVLARAWSTDPGLAYRVAGIFAAEFSQALGLDAPRAPVVSAGATPAARPVVVGADARGAGAMPLPSDDDVDRAFDEMLGSARRPGNALPTPVVPAPDAAPARASSVPPPPPMAARRSRATLVGVPPMSEPPPPGAPGPIPASSEPSSAAMRPISPASPAAVAPVSGAPAPAPAATATRATGTSTSGDESAPAAAQVSRPASTPPAKPLGATQRVAVPRIRPPGTLPAGAATPGRGGPAASAAVPTHEDSWEPLAGGNVGVGAEVPLAIAAEAESLVATSRAVNSASTPDHAADDTMPLTSSDMVMVQARPVTPDVDVQVHAAVPSTLPPALPSRPHQEHATESSGNTPDGVVAAGEGGMAPAAGMPLTTALPTSLGSPVSTLRGGMLPPAQAEAPVPAVPALPPAPTSAPPPPSAIPTDPPPPRAAPAWPRPLPVSLPGSLPPLSAHAPAASASPTAVRVARVMGPFVVLAAVVVTGGQIYVAQVAHETAELRMAAAVTAPRVHPTAAPVAAPTETAGGAVAHPSVPAHAAPAVVAMATADAGGATAAAAHGDAGVPPGVVLAADAATGSPMPAGQPVADAGGGQPPEVLSGPVPRHPHGRDADHLWDAMAPGVQACVGHEHARRHVRVVVSYTGATGAVDAVHVAPPFATAPVGTCIETAVRAAPIPRFSDRSWETTYVFDLE